MRPLSAGLARQSQSTLSIAGPSSIQVQEIPGSSRMSTQALRLVALCGVAVKIRNLELYWLRLSLPEVKVPELTGWAENIDQSFDTLPESPWVVKNPIKATESKNSFLRK